MQIHHIQPLHARPDLAFRIDNAAGVCASCHGRLNAMERAGTSTTGMFVIVADKPPQGRSKKL
ncbi:MAG: HNH endonuclease [Planctomycetes bacterium]|nr:HNH endonuclease [Planctomycetota bacterium]